MLKNLRRRLATMLYPDVLGDMEVKRNKTCDHESFDKSGWQPWPIGLFWGEYLSPKEGHTIYVEVMNASPMAEWKSNIVLPIKNNINPFMAGSPSLYWRPARLDVRFAESAEDNAQRSLSTHDAEMFRLFNEGRAR